MALKEDFYKILEVNKNASEAEIKKAYRKQARKYHPDKFSSSSETEKANAEKKFKEVNEAYQILSDPEKRSQYDNFGHAAFEQGGHPGGGQSYGQYGGQGYQDFDFSNFNFDFGGGNSAEDLGDIFGSFFGGRGARKRGPVPGGDLSMEIEISLEESAKGGEKTIRYARTNKDGAREEVEKKFKIPAGIADGQKLKLAKFGNASTSGGPHGDLYIHIKIKPDDLFVRDGFDIICKVPVSYYTAALGGEVEVPTLSGNKKIKIPAGTQSGKRFALREYGIFNPKTKKKGTHYAEVTIEVPVDLDEEQKILLKEFDDKLKDKNRKIKTSFLDKVKRFFKM
ncbi:DnaJ C-terminal domain-containing protein [Cetobacterium somerae]|uniref:DnaJ C-terminal domain-containing protein n=1 Tax=Cetobacterium somerae TaxID=188913 RepID=UPI003D769AA6